MRQWNKVCISQLNQVKPEWVYITINYVYLNCIGGQSSPWHLFFIIIFCLRNDSIVKIKGLIFKKSMLPQYHSCNRSHLLLVPDRCGTEAHLTVLKLLLLSLWFPHPNSRTELRCSASALIYFRPPTSRKCHRAFGRSQGDSQQYTDQMLAICIYSTYILHH